MQWIVYSHCINDWSNSFKFYYYFQAKKLADKAAKLSDKENKGDTDKKGKKRKNSGEAVEEEVKLKKEKKVTVSKYKVAADLVKAMKEDKLNSKVWKELLEKDYKTRNRVSHGF